MGTIRIVQPTAWDRQQLAARPDLLAQVTFVPPDDADCPDDFDVLGQIDGAIRDWRGDTDGVFSSSDYPGAAAVAAIAAGLGLPGSTPQVIMTANHKGLARAVQAAVAPANTPAFVVLDPERPPAAGSVPFPCFVKPAKGCFSVLARRVDDHRGLVAFLSSRAVADYRHRYLRIYRRLVERYLGPAVDGTAFVAEAVLRGRLVTVEGFSTGDAAIALGVVDALCEPQSGSFVAFEYPSALPDRTQARLEELACRVAAAHGLRWTMWNVELMWDAAADTIGIVEINPRMCGQFADLYEKVDGIHGHAIALDLCRGRVPQLRRRGGAHRFAASFPLRVFEPVVVERAPEAADLRRAAGLFPGTLVWNEVRAGAVLRDFAAEDGASIRYGVINLGAPERAALAGRRDAVLGALGWRFRRCAEGGC